ncbi:MAG: argininosuccinate lyase [Pseudomonadota bacterium]
MRRIGSLLIVIGLAGCGVDGEPTRPEVTTTLGIGVGSDGQVKTRAQTRLDSGGFGVSLGL